MKVQHSRKLVTTRAFDRYITCQLCRIIQEVYLLKLLASRKGSCEQHTVCGTVVTLDTVLRLRKVEILNGKFKSVVVAVESKRTWLIFPSS